MVLTPSTADGNSPSAATCSDLNWRQDDFVMQTIILTANRNNIKSPEK